MRRSRSLALLVVLFSGCGAPQPERVYIDISRALAAETSVIAPSVQLPGPRGEAPPVSVRQPGMPATIVSDSTSERLEAAKRLIAENRSRSIASLTSMLDRIYQARASDEIARRAKDAEPEQDTILKAAVERLENAFNIYAGRREPLLTRLSATARSVALEPVPIPMSSSPSATIRIKEANDLRSQIRALDSGFDTEAAQILTDAQKEIQTETAALRNQASKTQADARDQAIAEAESQANATQVSLNVQVTKLLPENLPAVA